LKYKYFVTLQKFFQSLLIKLMKSHSIKVVFQK